MCVGRAGWGLTLVRRLLHVIAHRAVYDNSGVDLQEL